MIYPDYLKKKDYIGLTALSSGCSDSLDELKDSIHNLNEFKIIVTNNNYGDYIVSSSVKTRVLEFNSLLDKVNMIFITRGGEHLIETLPYLDYDKIVEKKIWIEGYSDPTSLLYLLTTKYDLSTIYGYNGKSFYLMDKSHKNNLLMLKGKIIKQVDNNCYSLKGKFKEKGIIIGGCLDVLKEIFNTDYDYTDNFINKYSYLGIIWYFDIYDMNEKEVKEIIDLMMKKGYFKNTKLILVSRLLNNIDSHNYIDCFSNLDCHIVMDVAIGHVKPTMTIINGMLGKINFNNKLELEMKKIHEKNIS